MAKFFGKRKASTGNEHPDDRPNLIPSDSKGLNRLRDKSAQKDEYYVSDEDLDRLEEQESAHESRDWHPVRFARDRRTGCLGGLMYAAFVISVSIVLACMAWMAASDVLALNKAEHSAMVTVESGFEMDNVIDSLKDAGLIEYKFLFRLFCALSKAETKIRPGEYSLSTKHDYRTLVAKMQTGSSDLQTIKLTFPEGYTMAQMFELLAENNICTIENLQDSAANTMFTYSFLEDEKIVRGELLRLEGYLLPDTYEFFVGEQASSVIDKFLNNFYRKLTADMKLQAENLHMSIRDILIIASMIEREAGEAADDVERASIASVIYNRLDAGMRLQIDATVIYALGGHKTVLTATDLNVDSPYNTHRNLGLPPGAISNPGMNAIRAALLPATTDYYYYALDVETGTHRFFTNYVEHEQFVATQNYG